jgi:hypothetical protein
MRRLLAVMGAMPFVLASVVSVVAQGGGFVTQTPGRPPSFTSPTPGGGYIVQTPG